MFATLFFSMSLAWQSGIASDSRPLDLVEMMYEQQAQEEALERGFRREADATKEHLFELRFNDASKALVDLGKTEAWFDTSAHSK